MWVRIGLAVAPPLGLDMRLGSALDDPVVGWGRGIAVGLGCAIAIMDDDGGG